MRIPKIKNKKVRQRSASHHLWKSKEQCGDALLRFLAYDIYIKLFSDFNPITQNHTIPIDLFINNSVLIEVAEKLNLEVHPDECAYYQEQEKMIFESQGIVKKIKRPLANAFEVHLYEIFQNEGFDSAYQFIEKTMFSGEIFERIKKRSKEYFSNELMEL